MSGPEGAPLEVAVVGVGAFGRNHARVWSELPGARLACVVDRDPAAAAPPPAKHPGPPQAAPPAKTPRRRARNQGGAPVHHAAVAVPLLRRGVACLVEKPFAATLEDGEAMVRAARESGAVLATGHIERFNPAIASVDPRAFRPRFLEVNRISPFSFRSADVGVVLDLMIHDLDLILHLAGSEPVRVEAVGVPVLTPHEDIANARIEFAGGCVANVTASRVGTKTERKLRMFSSDSYMVLDFAQRQGWTYRKAPGLTLEKVMALRKDAKSLADLKGMVLSGLVEMSPVRISEEEPLKAELGSFLEAVRNGTVPVVSGEDGLRALRLALRVVACVKERLAAG